MNKQTLNKKYFIAAATGTMVEYYDYAIFSLYLPIIAPLFFPAETAYGSLIKGYWILLLTALARPLGGLFFGYIGDRYGRRKALLTSMYGIALATTAIGVIPSYLSIGIAATLFVIVAKTIQLFCYGGEYNGAGIYVVEHARGVREGLAGSLLAAMNLMGSLLAAIIGLCTALPFLPTWTWRVAFILGGIVGLIGILYRKQMVESPDFKPLDPVRHSTGKLLKHFPLQLFTGFCIGALATVPYTTVLVFITPVLVTDGYFSNFQFMLIETITAIAAVTTLVLVGYLADWLSPARVMRFACWMLFILALPLLWLIDNGNTTGKVFAMIIFVILNELFLGPSNAYLKNLFPAAFRYRGTSLSFCLGMAILGGITPLVDSYLYQFSHHFNGLAIWLMFTVALNLICLYANERWLPRFSQAQAQQMQA